MDRGGRYAGRPRQAGTNPFGDDPADNGGGRNVSRPRGGANPFDDDDDNNHGRNGGRGGGTNPFGDGDDEDDPLAGFGRRKARGGLRNRTPPRGADVDRNNGGGTNPFGDDDEGPAHKSRGGGAGSNPFDHDDDDHDDHDEAGRRGGIRKSASTDNDAPSASGTSATTTSTAPPEPSFDPDFGSGGGGSLGRSSTPNRKGVRAGVNNLFNFRKGADHHEADDAEGSRPMASAVDADHVNGHDNGGHDRPGSKSPARRPGGISLRSKTAGEAAQATTPGQAREHQKLGTNLKSWLRGNKAADDSDIGTTTASSLNHDGGSDGGCDSQAPRAISSNSDHGLSKRNTQPSAASRAAGAPSAAAPAATGGPPTTTKKTLVNRLGRFGRADKEKPMVRDSAPIGPERGGGNTTGYGGGRAVAQRWPFDDYHKEQETYYESLVESAADPGPDAHDVYEDDDERGYHSGSDDDHDAGKGGRKQGDASGTELFERPSQLPSIKEAVQDLQLAEFEKKAQERAIGIISTWIFDAGLIDELLVTGATRTSSAKAAAAAAADQSRAGEGIEVGRHGFPLLGAAEGALKMDKEILKLRSSIQRELGHVNARLNDCVAATGAEVQELVDAVQATKSDLRQLRDLSTYISSGGRPVVPEEDDGDIDWDGPVEKETPKKQATEHDPSAPTDEEQRDGRLLSDFPHLRRAMNARRNLNRCFRELEFFTQISSTCDRLREDLHSGEWTADEWNTIRNVCMEHVELEILLVEAEAGMKARIGGDDTSSQYGASAKSRGRDRLTRRTDLTSSTFVNYEMVDKFLEQHVKNVWELGDEIRMRILSGIGSAYDLAMNNPSAVVALVEAVEVYERAAEQFKQVDKDKGGPPANDSGDGRIRLRFTDMRAAALSQLYQDFEMRGLEVFRNVHSAASNIGDEKEQRSAQFTSALRACTELVAEVDVVKNKMAPCFAPNWSVEVLWSSCVAHVCSNQILQQIGGPDGHNLPDLTVTQLLDLVAWVEFFRETMLESFPQATAVNAKKTYFDARPDLFADDKRNVDMDTAADSIAWVNSMLWEVHHLAQDEFLLRTRTQTDEWLENVYKAEHTKNQTSEGRLTTSLCEDVFSLASVQMRTIRERLSRKSEALIMAVCVIFSHLRAKQIHSRDDFLEDLETCCAAANDFTRMSEKSEEIMSELERECEFSEDSLATLEAGLSELIALYSSDAVYAAQSVHIYVFEPIAEAIAGELFGAEWEEQLTHNELALTLTRTLEDFMGDLEQFLDDWMLRKSVDALLSASVVFYIKCLLLRAEHHTSVKVPFFGDIERALERMNGDIKVMRGYFEGLVPRMPALGKIIEREFEVLTTLLELLSLAGGLSQSDASDFILVLHKRVRDVNLTKHCVSDLWHLVAPTEERSVWELVETMEQDLIAVAPMNQNAVREAQSRSYVPGLRVDEMMAKLYIGSKRKRPVKPGTLEKVVTNWKKNWYADEGEDGE